MSVVIAAIEVALYPSVDGPRFLLVTFSAVGVLYVAAGAVAWGRRPSNRMGPLLALAGLAMLVAAGGNASLPLLATIGEHAAMLPLAVVLHLLLAFPSGRLRDRRARLVAAAGYVSAVGIQIGQVHSRDPAAWAQAQNICGAILVGLATAVLVRRIRAAAAPQQRTLTPLYAYGTIAEGLSNAAIARRLVVSEKAVVQHASNIYAALGLAPSADDHRRVLAVVRHLAREPPQDRT